MTVPNVPDQTRIDAESAGLLRQSFVATRRCAQCWQPVVLKWLDGKYQIVCPRGCQPGGHVSEDYVNYRRAQDAIDACKVEANYPSLVRDKPTPEQIKHDRDALWPGGA